MNRAEFGQLMAALRKENIDVAEHKPWTQRRLADEANLPIKTIGEIEGGRKMNLDPQTLTQLADALRLNSLERASLLAAASEVDINPLPDIKPAHTILEELLTATQTICVPAMIYDSYFNIVAGNSIMFAISDASDSLVESGRQSPAGFNLLRYVFDDNSSFRDVAGPNWRQYGLRNVQHFRATSLKYRFTDRFRSIFVDLCRINDFQEAWARSKYTTKDMYSRWDEYNYVHPRFGPLNYISVESESLTSQENLFLVTHVPRNRETVHAFEKLGRDVGLNMHRFAPWPYE